MRAYMLGLATSLGLAATIGVLAWSGQAIFASPRIEVRDLDLGSVEPGETIERAVRVRNAGSAPLLLSDVKACCGAWLPYGWPQAIAPSSEELVIMRITLPFSHAPFSRSLALTSNDPRQPVTTARVTAVPKKTLMVQPASIDLGIVAPHTQKRAAAEITGDEIAAGRMSVIASVPWLQAQLDPSPESDTVSIDVAIDPSAPRGPVDEYLYLRTGVKEKEAIPIHVTGTLERGVRIRPAKLFFGSVQPNATAEVSVRVLPLEDSWKACKITRTGATFLQPELLPHEDGTLLLRVQLDPRAMPQAVTSDITIENPDGDSVTIPVYAVLQD